MKKIIAFVTPPSTSHRTAEENLGIKYIASTLISNNYKVKIVDGWLEGYSRETIIKKLTDSNLCAVGFSSYLTSLEDVRYISLYLKEINPEITIFAGGFGPTFNSKEFLDASVDYIVFGEAESIINSFIDGIVKKYDKNYFFKIPGIGFYLDGKYFKTSDPIAVKDLDELAFPFRLNNKRNVELSNPIHVLTSRGCTAFCNFCSIAAFAKRMENYKEMKWRGRSIKNIVDEIEINKIKFNVKTFKFVDDSFIDSTRDEEWSYQFKKEILSRELKINFRTQIRADKVTHGIAKNLSEAGWFATSVGIESGSETVLRRMRKHANIEDNQNVINILEENNIYVVMNMILFDNETSLFELRETLEFLKSNKWPITKGIYSEMFASEGTTFTGDLKKKSFIVDLDSKKFMNYSYKIESLEVQFIREALRGWHLEYDELYNCAINPIAAPKVVTAEGYKEFHKLSRELYEMDLIFFENVLNSQDNSNLLWLLKSELSRTEDFRVNIKLKIEELYKKYNLQKPETKNKFIQL